MPNIIHTQGGKLTGDTSRENVRSIFSGAFSKPHPGGIVIHLHGGLVNKADGLEIANRLDHEYGKAGAYPITFVWETGVLEALRNNLAKISDEPFFQKVRDRVVKMVKRKYHQNPGERSSGILSPASAEAELQAIEDARTDREALRQNDPVPPPGMTEVTEVEKVQLENELQYDHELTLEIQKISEGLLTPDQVNSQKSSRSASIRGSSASLMDPEALEQYIARSSPRDRGIISTASFFKAVVIIVVNVVKRVVNRRDHGFHATIVEEILRAFYIGNAGKRVWGLMKTDGYDHFKEDGNVYAGTAMLEELTRHLATSPDTKITVVGHSAGAVFANAFLRAADAALPPATQLDVIYLAPAATMELTSETLANHGSRIRNFRMFGMKDENERRDILVERLPYFYPSSLLYLVSGLFEGETDTPITGMQRFHDVGRFPGNRFPHIPRVLDFMNGDIVWSTTEDGAGRNSGTLDHGAFDNDTETLASLRHILSKGF